MIKQSSGKELIDVAPFEVLAVPESRPGCRAKGLQVYRGNTPLVKMHIYTILWRSLFLFI